MHTTQDKIYTGKELFNLPDEPNDYLIDGILWENQCIMVLAAEKVGKSIFSIQMACSLSSGEAFLGYYEIPEPMKVLYIQTESTRQETIERLRSMTTEVNWDDENFHLLYTESLALDTEAGYNNLVLLINNADVKPKVIFLDPLYMSMLGSLTDEKDARNMCRRLRNLMKMFNCALVIPHHEHRPKYNKDNQKLHEKDNSIMGSFVWKAFMNHVLYLEKRSHDKRYLSCETQRAGRVIQNMELHLNSDPLHYSVIGSPDHPSYYDKILAILDKAGTPKCAEDLRKESDLSINAVRKALGYFHKTKKIKKVNPGSRPVLYQVNHTNNGDVLETPLVFTNS